MILAFFVCLLFVEEIYRFYRNGLFYQWGTFIYLFFITLVAGVGMLPLSKILELWVPYPGYNTQTTYAFFPPEALQIMDDVFYRVLAFFVILLIGWILKSVIWSWVYDVKFLNYNRKVTLYSAIFVGTVNTWYYLFFIFSLLSLVGLPSIQHFFDSQFIASLFVRHTPILTETMFKLWFNQLALIQL